MSCSGGPGMSMHYTTINVNGNCTIPYCTKGGAAEKWNTCIQPLLGFCFLGFIITAFTMCIYDMFTLFCRFNYFCTIKTNNFYRPIRRAITFWFFCGWSCVRDCFGGISWYFHWYNFRVHMIIFFDRFFFFYFFWVDVMNRKQQFWSFHSSGHYGYHDSSYVSYLFFAFLT